MFNLHIRHLNTVFLTHEGVMTVKKKKTAGSQRGERLSYFSASLGTIKNILSFCGFQQVSFRFSDSKKTPVTWFSGVLRPHWRRSAHRKRLIERSSWDLCSCFLALRPPELTLHFGLGHRCFLQGYSWKTKRYGVAE